MIISLFLLVLGGYYLGKYFLGLNDGNTYKLMLVIFIIVFLSEMFLLVLKMNKESESGVGGGSVKLKKSSFAYMFNKKYRDEVEKIKFERRGKVHQKID